MKTTHLLLAVAMLASSATTLPAQTPHPRTPSTLNWVARFLGLGWSAGYHARPHAAPIMHEVPAMYGVYGRTQMWRPFENVPPPAQQPQPQPADPTYLSIPQPPRDAAAPALNRGAAYRPFAPEERISSYGRHAR